VQGSDAPGLWESGFVLRRLQPGFVNLVVLTVTRPSSTADLIAKTNKHANPVNATSAPCRASQSQLRQPENDRLANPEPSSPHCAGRAAGSCTAAPLTVAVDTDARRAAAGEHQNDPDEKAKHRPPSNPGH
jgi:hypothetical protein